MQKAAFDEFCRHIEPELRRRISKRVRHGDVEDIMQLTLVSVWQDDRPDPITDRDFNKLRAFTFKIADRRCADFWRNEALHTEKFEELIRSGGLNGYTLDAIPEPESIIPDQWLVGLTTEQLETLNLYVQAYRVKEIALKLNTTENAISSRLKRIKEHLLTKAGEDNGEF